MANILHDGTDVIDFKSVVKKGERQGRKRKRIQREREREQVERVSGAYRFHSLVRCEASICTK